jgi:hypothetical protein
MVVDMLVMLSNSGGGCPCQGIILDVGSTITSAEKYLPT